MLPANELWAGCFTTQMCKKCYCTGFSTEFTQQKQVILQCASNCYLSQYTLTTGLLLKFWDEPLNVIKGNLKMAQWLPVMTACNIWYCSAQCLQFFLFHYTKISNEGQKHSIERQFHLETKRLFFSQNVDYSTISKCTNENKSEDQTIG